MPVSRLAGTAYVTVDGVSVSIVGEGTYKVTSVTRETLKGADGIHGYKEMPDAGSITWRGRITSGVPISTLDLTNSTVLLVSAAGAQVIGRNMWRVGEPLAVNTEEATFEIAFEGPDVSETYS